MAIGALTPPQEEMTPKEVLIEFPDNRLMVELCGEHSRNLAVIEKELDVQICLLVALDNDGAQ